MSDSNLYQNAGIILKLATYFGTGQILVKAIGDLVLAADETLTDRLSYQWISRVLLRIAASGNSFPITLTAVIITDTYPETDWPTFIEAPEGSLILIRGLNLSDERMVTLFSSGLYSFLSVNRGFDGGQESEMAFVDDQMKAFNNSRVTHV